jgi:hypothetical protein
MCCVLKRKYLIRWYLGSVAEKNLVKQTKYIAMDTPHARKFAKLRKPRLIAVITPVK